MRTAIAVALLAAGCGRFDFSDSHADAGTTSDSPASPDAVQSCAVDPCANDQRCASDDRCHPILFSDDFEAASINSAWSLMRFDFALDQGHLQTQPTVRAGFNYGQGGNGRSAVAALHIGDAAWTDIRVEWTQQSQASLLIVDSTLPACQHTPGVMYRIQDYQESWNAPQDTLYSWSIDQAACGGPIGPQGSWGTGQTFEYWIPGTGYSSAHMGSSTQLGNGLATINDVPVHFVLELRGTRARVWADGVQVYDIDDATVSYPLGDAPLTSGGVAFTSAWEQMFWIDDVVVSDLTQ
ncbi:MAG TPA: hypothetical protein VGM39_22085 [Kofleriaceae bacterium]